jgi:hypothetical protein
LDQLPQKQRKRGRDPNICTATAHAALAAQTRDDESRKPKQAIERIEEEVHSWAGEPEVPIHMCGEILEQ